jgi:hypothetical protein
MSIIGVVGPSLDNMPNDIKLKAKLREAIIFAISDFNSIASGEATGIDTFTKEITIAEGKEYQGFKPKHNHWDGKSKYCPTPDFCYGFKARNMALATYVDKLVCVTFNIEDLEPEGKFIPKICHHCLRRMDSKLVTHQSNGGCWTLNYAQDLNKETELIEVVDW